MSASLSTPASDGAVTGVIEQGCELEGRLYFHGTFRIGGVFKGQIFTPDTLIIGEGARVEATISAGIVIISGEMIGSVQATHRVEIHRPAIFKGDIVTPSLSVDEGVLFEGSSKVAQTGSAPARSFLNTPQ